MKKIKSIKPSNRLEREYEKYLLSLGKAIYKAFESTVNLNEFSDTSNIRKTQLQKFNDKVEEILKKVPLLATLMQSKNYKYFNTSFNNLISPSFDIDLKRYYRNDKTLLEQTKSNSEEYILKYGQENASWLRTEVRANYINGGTRKELAKNIEERFKVTENRAKLIARNETSSFIGAMNTKRAKDLGIALYQWQTMEDERVRPKDGVRNKNKDNHRRLNHKYCSYDDDTVYADTLRDAEAGRWKKRSSIGAYIGKPLEDIQCRCQAIYILP